MSWVGPGGEVSRAINGDGSGFRARSSGYNGHAQRATVGRSPIHGRGLFARRRLRGDSLIGTFEGTPTTRDGEHVLWVLDDDGRHYGIIGRNDLRFLNHSRRPNAEFRGADLYALRNIQTGAEILIHYGDDWEDVE